MKEIEAERRERDRETKRGRKETERAQESKQKVIKCIPG